jgi:hypothetical protein
MTPPDTTVADAQAEAAEAADLLAALTDRVRAGDESITASELAAQKQLAEFATLRVEAAQRRHAADLEGARASTARAAVDAARGLLAPASIAPLVDAVTAVKNAVADLIAFVDDRNARIAEIGTTLSTISQELAAYGATGLWPTERYGIRSDGQSVTVLGAGHVHRVSAGQLAAAALVVGLDGAVEPVQAEADARGLLGGLVDAQVRKLGEELPALADAWRYTPEEWATAGQRQRYRATEQGRRPA